MALATWTRREQTARLAEVDTYLKCKGDGRHIEFRNGICIDCKVSVAPHRECASHGPFLNGKCRNCDNVGNPILNFVEEAGVLDG